MIETRDALLFLDLDKGAEPAGPLFEEPRRRLESDPALRAAWAQYQALRALAWECAPEPGEKLLRLALAETRRQRVRQQLARAAGSEDLAREILLGRAALEPRRGLPGWVWILILAGLAGLTWTLLGPQLQALLTPSGAARFLAEARPLPLPPTEEGGVPFEFPSQDPPAQAALAPPTEGASHSAEVRREDEAARQARQLLREHLRGQAPAAAPPRTAAAPQRPAPDKAAPAAVRAAGQPPTAPTAVPTEVPSAGPAAVPTAAPTAIPTAVAAAAPAPTEPPPPPSPTAAPKPGDQASFSLSAHAARPGGRLRILLGLPERRDVDLRLFDQRGRPIKGLHSGDLGPGQAELELRADDEHGRPLAPGTYYLRVMTPWFSRVEPIEITP